MKAKIDSKESTVKKGGMGADRVLSKYRNPKSAEKFIKSGGLKKNAKDAAYYKSIGLTGKRGDQAVKRFFKKMGGSLKGYQEGGKVKKKKSIIQSIIDIPKTIKSNNDAIRKIGKKMDKEKRLKDKMSKAESKAFSESLKQPRKLERLDDKIKENAKKVAMMRATGQI